VNSIKLCPSLQAGWVRDSENAQLRIRISVGSIEIIGKTWAVQDVARERSNKEKRQTGRCSCHRQKEGTSANETRAKRDKSLLYDTCRSKDNKVDKVEKLCDLRYIVKLEHRI